MAKKQTIKTDGWRAIMALDLQPPPGSFVSTKFHEYEIEGEKVTALNFLHADFMFARMVIERRGGELGRCDNCGQSLRYVELFRDAEGNYFNVGKDCAQFIAAQMPREQYERIELIKTMREVNTRNGARMVLSFPVPDWFWQMPRASRPAFTSLGKYENRKRETVWTVTIWGANADEVLDNYAAFKLLRESAAAQPAPAPAEAAKPAPTDKPLIKPAPAESDADAPVDVRIKRALDEVSRAIHKTEADRAQVAVDEFVIIGERVYKRGGRFAWIGNYTLARADGATAGTYTVKASAAQAFVKKVRATRDHRIDAEAARVYAQRYAAQGVRLANYYNAIHSVCVSGDEVVAALGEGADQEGAK